MWPDEGGLRKHDAYASVPGDSSVEPCPTEDQARAGGCCLCDEGCGGLDVSDEDRARGVVECFPHCAWCINGCPAPVGGPCFCVTLAVGAP